MKPPCLYLQKGSQYSCVSDVPQSMRRGKLVSRSVCGHCCSIPPRAEKFADFRFFHGFPEPYRMDDLFAHRHKLLRRCRQALPAVRNWAVRPAKFAQIHPDSLDEQTVEVIFL